MNDGYGANMGYHSVGMTPKQKQTLDWISSYIDKTGCSPSFQEIMDGTGQKAKSAVSRVVGALEARGKIRRLPGAKRSIEVVQSGEKPFIFQGPRHKHNPLAITTLNRLQAAKTEAQIAAVVHDSFPLIREALEKMGGVR